MFAVVNRRTARPSNREGDAERLPILGTAPSYRGPVYRGKICEKTYDGLRNFQRHPKPRDHRSRATRLALRLSDLPLSMFETKRDKPLRAYASNVSFYFKDREWRFNVTVGKTEADGE